MVFSLGYFDNVFMRKNAKLPKVLGKKMKRIRKDRGLTQEEVADKIGVSRAYVGYIEQGRNAPSLEVLEKIARVLKTPINSFF